MNGRTLLVFHHVYRLKQGSEARLQVGATFEEFLDSDGDGHCDATTDDDSRRRACNKKTSH